MGEVAADMIDGTTCSNCGQFFRGDPVPKTKYNPTGTSTFTHGYPVLCWKCWDGASTKLDRRQYSRALMPTL